MTLEEALEVMRELRQPPTDAQISGISELLRSDANAIMMQSKGDLFGRWVTKWRGHIMDWDRRKQNERTTNQRG